MIIRKQLSLVTNSKIVIIYLIMRSKYWIERLSSVKMYILITLAINYNYLLVKVKKLIKFH